MKQRKTMRASEPSALSERLDLRENRNETAPRIFYEDDAVTLWLGDCLDVLPQLEPVDHVITDPPYDEVTHVGARSLAREYADKATVCNIDFDSISASALRDVFSAMKMARWLIASVDWRHVRELERQPPDGMRFVRFGVWVKPNGAPQFTGDRPATGWEALVFLHRDCPGRMHWNGGGNHAVYTHSKQNEKHPTAKPLALLVDLVSDFTDEGETILDPFAGSGTTLVAAKLNGRKAIGIERDATYCAVAAERLQRTQPGRLFDSLKAKPQSLLAEVSGSSPASQDHK